MTVEKKKQNSRRKKKQNECRKIETKWLWKRNKRAVERKRKKICAEKMGVEKKKQNGCKKIKWVY